MPLCVALCSGALGNTFGPLPAAWAYTIEGKIEHVEKMPAVDRRFTPGAEFDQNAELSPDNRWIKIPNWLAGSWSARDETAVFSRDYRSGREDNRRHDFKAKQNFAYGQQIDKTGQVWHYLGVPYTSKSVHSDSREIHQVTDKQLLKASDEEIEFRAVATVLIIGNDSERIKRTYQQESLTTYQPISNDRITMTASTKVFDASGKAQTLQQNEAMIKRSKRFESVNEKDGKNLLVLFRQFMTAKGLADLLVD